MDDYISRAALIECLGDRPENWMDKPEEIQAVADWDAFSGIVRRLPSADVRQVVRCEECVFWDKVQDGKCGMFSGECTENHTPPDGFCFAGIRREEANSD